MKRINPWWVAIFLAACEGGTGPPDFPDLELESFSPPIEYETWWAETEECSGLTGMFDRISFYQVAAPLSPDRTSFPCGEGFWCNGLWQAPHDIYLAPAVHRVKRLVKHEMLHDLIGFSGHPAVFHECNLSWPTSGSPSDSRALLLPDRAHGYALQGQGSRPAPAQGVC